MTQNGVVTKLLDQGMAEVAVERGTACGHCTGCGECVYGKRILVAAKNKIFAKPGDKVTLETETGVIVQAAVLVYLIPVAMLFLGYAIGALMKLGQGQCIVVSLVSCAVGAAIVTIVGRRHKKIDYEITGYSR